MAWGVGFERTVGAACEEEEHGFGWLCAGGALFFVKVGVGSTRRVRARCDFGVVRCDVLGVYDGCLIADISRASS
jgi:hypothetical protein